MRRTKTSHLLLVFLAIFSLLLSPLQAEFELDDEKKDLWNASRGLVLEGTIVTMNAQDEVIQNGRLFVQGKQIVAIAGPGESLPEAAKDAKVVKTDGAIYPGLINAHNHISYNFLSLYDVPEKYDNRYQWTRPASYKANVNGPKKLINAKRYLNLDIEAAKYAELKSIVGGETAVQGSPPWGTGFNETMVRNIEMKNFGDDKIRQHGLSITDGRFLAKSDRLVKQMKTGELNAWICHLAEGVDESSRQEYYTAKKYDLLQPQTVVIHGTALGKKEFEGLAEIGCSLVWSPLSNLLLYGETTDVPTAIKAGLSVSLASDWAPSGAKNVLGELKIADQWNKREWNGFLSDKDLVAMVTRNPAKAVGFDGKVGTLEEGHYADIAVYDYSGGDVYRNLIDSTERNVILVTIDGEPLYGDEPVMADLKGDDIEVIWNKGGREKAVDFTHPEKEDVKADQTAKEVMDILDKALEFDPDWVYDHSNMSKKMTRDEFMKHWDKKFRNVKAMKRDPLFTADDPNFFESIKNSPNAGLEDYDFESYYKDADASEPEGIPAVVDIREGYHLRVREEPRRGKILARLPDGTPVTILKKKKVTSRSTWAYLRTESGLEGWGSMRYLDEVPDAKAGDSDGIVNALTQNEDD